MTNFLQPSPVFLEITPGSLKAWRENSGIEWQLERLADGKLTAACRDSLIVALQAFSGRKSWHPRVRAVCAISAHGVSLRKITLPVAAGEELERVLRLQIEHEFPLPPDELAWGWQELSRASAKLEVVVAAVRKETIQNYDQILAAAGLDPDYTLSACARNVLCRESGGATAVLEIGSNYHELACFQNGTPTGLTIVPGEGDLAGVILKHTADRVLYVSGSGASADRLLQDLSLRTDCRRLTMPDSAGCSAATEGLRISSATGLALLRLRTQTGLARTRFNLPRLDLSEAESRRWLRRGAALMAMLLLLPFAEALVLKPWLARKLETLESEKQNFVSTVEPERQFLEALKQRQPPYLDAIYVLSQAAPQGFRLETLTLNQNGDLQLRASLPGARQVMDFRSKLIHSGFFATITVDDQSAVENQQKVNVRITARWQSAAARAQLRLEPPPDASGKPDAGGPAPGRPENSKTPPA